MGKILIIGAGNMGFAIATGTIDQGIKEKSEILFLEKRIARVKELRRKRFQISKDIEALKKEKNISIIILAVKPNDIGPTLEEVKPLIKKNTLVISIAAGVKIKTLSRFLGKAQPLARIMPNTPCQVAEGISALTFNTKTSKKQKADTRKIFKALGSIVEVKEKHFDLVTALSGSGPAYFCYIVENMLKAGKELGLDPKTAKELAAHTARGTASLILSSKLSPEELRKAVTSPKGTTEAAINVFNRAKTNKTIQQAIKAAHSRSIELGKNS